VPQGRVRSSRAFADSQEVEVTRRFAYVVVVPPFAGAGQDEHVVARYMEMLGRAGAQRVGDDALDFDAPLAYLVATGGTEGEVMRLREARAASDPHEPVVLIAHPGNNSLPASLEVLARLQQQGLRGRIVYLAGPDDEAGLASLGRVMDDLAVARALRGTRIGLVGEPSDWLVASMPDHDVLRDRWGPVVVPVPLDEVIGRLEGVRAGEAAAAAAALGDGAEGVAEPSADDLAQAARVWMALREVAEQYALDALTVRCFDIVLECGTTGCIGLAELTDAGVIAGCEGDLVSTLALVWTRLLTGSTPWMANPSRVDEAANALWLAHCTVPRSIVDGYRLRSHFESGLGVGIQGRLPHGPVTLARIGGVALDRIWLVEGEVTKTGDAEDLCRTQAFVRLKDGHVSELLRRPLGNHIVVVSGHHAARMRDWFEMMVR
jgi:L-fucose isomerase-like protein